MKDCLQNFQANYGKHFKDPRVLNESYRLLAYLQSKTTVGYPNLLNSTDKYYL
jgi:hypothetical protein